MKDKISSVEVAREAGVSRTTVSYVLNNTAGVKIKPETREKVLEAAKKLGYFGNSIARSMKTGRAMSIGFVSKWNVTHQRFIEVLNGMKDILSEQGYSITLCTDNYENNETPEYLNYYFGKKIDGIILLSAGETLSSDTINLLKDRNVPFVLAGYDYSDINLNSVNIDYYQGSYSATSYLIEKGHANIISILHSTDSVQEKLRLKGIKQAIADSKRTDLSLRSLIINKNDGFGVQQITDALQCRDDYTAVIVSWRSTAFNVLYSANSLNIRIPQELSVISLDGSDFADFSYPRLSTSDLPLYELGMRSARILIDAICYQSEPIQITLPCRLNLREST